jgi:hypothetical protein
MTFAACNILSFWMVYRQIHLIRPVTGATLLLRINLIRPRTQRSLSLLIVIVQKENEVKKGKKIFQRIIDSDFFEAHFSFLRIIFPDSD